MQGNKSKLRVALLGIYHESNTFLPQLTMLADFKAGHLFKGVQIRDEYADAHHEIGGMLEVLDQNAIEAVPVFFAEATPGGPVEANTFHALLNDLLQELEKAGPLDACLVVPHGAAVSEEFQDMDGHWLSLIRKQLGQIPIVGTLDPHANVSQLMVDSTDVLIAYSTNPHIDQRQTGRKAAELLVEILKGEIKPVQTLIQLPLAISIEQQQTSVEPCKSLYGFAAAIVESNNLLSLSIILGFPYADVFEMGTSFIVISDDLQGSAEAGVEEMSAYILKNRNAFVAQKNTIGAELKRAGNSPKPVLLLDMGDNVGGGSAGDSTYLLEALEREGQQKTFICIYDPEAVNEALRHEINDDFSLSFGHNYQTEEPAPFTSEVTLLRITDGKFKEEQPCHGGQVSYDMGLTAIVLTKSGNVVMLNSNRIAPFSLGQLTSFGIVPADFDIIIAKGVNAPIAAYGPVCKTVIKMNTPGVTQADMTQFKYHNRRRPLFPFED